MHRRTVLKIAAQTAAAVAAAPLLNFGRFRLFAASPREYSARCIELVRRSNVIDMLNVFSLYMVLAPLMGEKNPSWLQNPALLPASELQRARESGYNVLHIAVGLGDYDSTLR
ncbi:MAG TPA: hypothetical protein VEG63_12605, partial [Candidatus Acidoferrales bacterium]|nr:hypothetical protein [Candidatus Acidoferrales bacterium]